MGSVLEEFDLDARAGETVQDLSIGTKRRVQVAKLFMIDAPIIFLDESTTGMDPLMKRRVLDRIRAEANNGRTVLLTTQVLSEAEQLCDTIMIIESMKMEIPVIAPVKGTLASLLVKEGQEVSEGQDVAVIET